MSILTQHSMIFSPMKSLSNWQAAKIERHSSLSASPKLGSSTLPDLSAATFTTALKSSFVGFCNTDEDQI